MWAAVISLLAAPPMPAKVGLPPGARTCAASGRSGAFFC